MAEMQLSSPMTPLVKFGWPIGWLGMMSYFTFLAFVRSPRLRWGPGVSPAWGKALLLGLLLLGLLIAYKLCMPLKKAWLTADGIRASNYFRQAFIAWPHVRCVVVRGEFGHRSTPVVEFELWQPHPFGGRISLLPASQKVLAELTGQATTFGVKLEHRPA
ncbi:MAG TPA: hypothetical protein VF756_15565 [Thermoanaerobaculia bacterium]